MLDTLGYEYKDTIQLLVDILDKPVTLLDPFDGLTDQYWVRRFKNKLSHKITYQEVAGLYLQTRSNLDESGEMAWVMVPLSHETVSRP